MGSSRQELYEKLCKMSSFARNGLFLLISAVWVLGTGRLLGWLVHFIFPVMESTVAVVAAGVMWLVWGVVCAITLLYLSLMFQGK